MLAVDPSIGVENMPDLESQVATGATWAVTRSLAIRLIGLVSTLILLRLLDPTDFGILAMATSVAALLELLTAFSFETVLIQDQSADRRKYDTAWTFNALFGFGLAIVLIIGAAPVANFYNEPRLVEVFTLLAVARVLRGIGNIGLVDFRKHLQFQKDCFYEVTVKCIGFVVTIPLAFVLRSYIALVLGMLVSQLAALILSYLVHPFRPRPSLAAAAEIFGFSRWLLLNNFTYFLRYRGADLIVGKLAGPFGLGIFSISYEISILATKELVAPMNRALFPGLSKISNEPRRLGQAFVRAAAVVALISLPFGFGIAVTADTLVPVVLGVKWIDAVPLVRVLAIFGAMVTITSPSGTALLASGRPKVNALMGVAHVAVLLPLVMELTSRWGAEGAALALLITALFFLPINYGIAARLLGLTIGDIGRIYFRPVIATAVMYVTVSQLLDQLGATEELLIAAIHLSVAIALGVFSYVVSILGL